MNLFEIQNAIESNKTDYPRIPLSFDDYEKFEIFKDELPTDIYMKELDHIMNISTNYIDLNLNLINNFGFSFFCIRRNIGSDVLFII